MRVKASRKYTSGSLPRHFSCLLLPLIAGNILQQLYNTIDTAVIGHYAGNSEFAAIGIASSVMNLLLFALIGACTGLSILLSQSYGSGDLVTFRRYHYTASVPGTAAIGAFSLLLLPLLGGMITFMRTPAELSCHVVSYLRVIILGLVISYLYNFYAAFLRSVGKASVALTALGIAVILNLLLDLLMVGYLQMGLTGAALATDIAQGFSALFCRVYIKKQMPELFPLPEERVTDSAMIRRMLKIALVTSVHQTSLYIGKLLVQRSVNQAGTEMIMAYTATTRIEGFANSFGDSGSAATSVLTAQNFGALRHDRTEMTFRTSLLFMLILGLVSSLFMFFGARGAVFLLLKDAGAAAQAEAYLKTVSFFYLFCFTGNTFAGYYDGLGLVSIPFWGALGHITLRVILSHFWIPSMGLKGAAIATGIGWVLVNLAWSTVKSAYQRRSHHVYSW